MSRVQKSASILLVDIGNSRIKWAFWQAGRLGRQHAEDYAGWTSEDFARHLFPVSGARHARMPHRIIAASVADGSVLRHLAAGARRAGRATRALQSTLPKPRGSGVAALELISTSRRAAGVVTRYREPWRLGVDRFLGVIAAHHVAGSQGACVINAGTAVTLDLVDGRGVHRGGAILPGPRLMMESLLRQTAGIARRVRRADASRDSLTTSRARNSSRTDTRAGRSSASFLARDTATAIRQGAANAVAGAVERAIAESGRELADAVPLVILTGGGAAELRRLLHVRCIEIPDLVLRGIALHAGLALR